MGKREGEDPCRVCRHYHNYEKGETCDICGHYGKAAPIQSSSFPSEILPEFLYLGGYDSASNFKVDETLGISRILNTVPLCENLYPRSFTYHRLQNEKALEFDSAIHFLEECENEKSRVLVHCMSGRNRSPAIVIAYLMKRKRWSLAESYQWVQNRRPSIDISTEFQQQLREFEKRLTKSRDGYGLPELNNQLQDLAFEPVNDDIRMDTC
ncbi:hypothetical protein EUTSA_v10005655mg [Eutrema salsugineum]|uniref:Tyrosine-protein phosphatase domain-containing protein n=1 Tax=Eutrema salsugineum TaxID=72664 RepID=V4K6M8_EUTSA|nr:protein-tyrosine-phosphatase IBR5 [Eutrema salsugineum]ESQ33235.1 hypothetical protein EUTSA_v10005655mg [Eutrema salsugineum]